MAWTGKEYVSELAVQLSFAIQLDPDGCGHRKAFGANGPARSMLWFPTLHTCTHGEWLLWLWSLLNSFRLDNSVQHLHFAEVKHHDWLLHGFQFARIRLIWTFTICAGLCARLVWTSPDYQGCYDDAICEHFISLCSLRKQLDMAWQHDATSNNSCFQSCLCFWVR